MFDPPLDPKRVLSLKDQIVEHFTAENWMELGVHTGCSEQIDSTYRLYQSLRFGDEDYSGCVLSAIKKVLAVNPANLAIMERYVADKFLAPVGPNVSTAPSRGPAISFTPSVFEVPNDPPNPRLVAVMMPFAPQFDGAYQAIQGACSDAGFQCQRASDIWNHQIVIQDVFSLIFRAQIVVCDFTGKNANVFYEAGIAHTLGKIVVPLTQSQHDIPFDIQHHRYLQYLGNAEGLSKLRLDLQTRLRTLDTGAMSGGGFQIDGGTF